MRENLMIKNSNKIHFLYREIKFYYICKLKPFNKINCMKFISLTGKKILLYYAVILTVSMLVFIPVDILVYNELVRINAEYFIVNFAVYTPFVLSCILIVDYFNTVHKSVHVVYRFIIEGSVLFVILFVILLVDSYINYKWAGVPFTIRDWIELRASKGYFFIDLMESLFVLIFTKVFYLYDREKVFELERERYKYEQLKRQINPHFLFNALNTLSAMCYSKKPEETAEYVSSLADMYRYVLSNEQKNLISLSEELNFTKSYTDILKQRFGEDLQLHINISRQNLDRSVLFMSLQTLIENAVKHNAARQDCPLTINVYDQTDVIVVENNINPKEQFSVRKTELGLNNLSSRYKYYTKRDIEIKDDGKFFTVKIPII